MPGGRQERPQIAAPISLVGRIQTACLPELRSGFGESSFMDELLAFVRKDHGQKPVHRLLFGRVPLEPDVQFLIKMKVVLRLYIEAPLLLFMMLMVSTILDEWLGDKRERHFIINADPKVYVLMCILPECRVKATDLNKNGPSYQNGRRIRM